MEALIFLLFILFSLFSALMERRKRKQRQLAQQRQGEVARPEQSQEPSHREEEEEDDQGWPFPVDPFELETKRPRRVDVLADDEAAAEQAAEQAAVAERRAEAERERADELARRAAGVQPRRRVQEMVRDRLAEQEQRGTRVDESMFRLNPKKAREAVIYSEILGKPKAERDDSD